MNSEMLVHAETSDGIVTLTLNRPQALNALNQATLLALQGALVTAEADPSVRCMVITGAGRAFVAGADIGAMREMTTEGAARFSELGHDVFAAIEQLPFPVIAAVNGFALGGGCELALACDFIFASESAVFGQPEVKLGIIPGFGGAQRLPRRIGIARARELIYTGRTVDATEALRIGLANAMYSPETLLAKTLETADTIAKMGPLAVTAAKAALRDSEDLALADALASEITDFANMFATEDQREGMTAFVERRQATFIRR